MNDQGPVEQAPDFDRARGRQIVGLLGRSLAGERQSGAALAEILYEDLRRGAERLMRKEVESHTLQATDLVSEAYLRLVGPDQLHNSRTHFLALAANVMRRVLVDHARRRQAERRGGGAVGVPLESGHLASNARPLDSMALEEALTDLSRLDPRAARVVELRFFGGLTEREVAQEAGVSERTVRNDWAFAKVWLHRRLFPADPG